MIFLYFFLKEMLNKAKYTITYIKKKKRAIFVCFYPVIVQFSTKIIQEGKAITLGNNEAKRQSLDQSSWSFFFFFWFCFVFFIYLTHDKERGNIKGKKKKKKKAHPQLFLLLHRVIFRWSIKSACT